MNLPKISIKLHIILVVGLFFILFSALFLYLANHYTQILAKDAAQEKFSIISRSIEQKMAQDITNLRSSFAFSNLSHTHQGEIQAKTLHPFYKTMKYILQSGPYYTNVYLADHHHNVFELFSLKRSDPKNSFFHAPPNSVYVASTIVHQHNKQQMYWIFLDSADTILEIRQHQTTYDPTTREWYKKALQTKNMILTHPYIFDHPKVTGITIAQQIGTHILGLDMMLTQFNTYLASLTEKHVELFLYNVKNNMIYSKSSMSCPRMIPQQLLHHIQAKDFNRILELREDGEKYFVYLVPSKSLNNDIIISQIPSRIILAPYKKKIQKMVYVIIAVIIFSMFGIVLLSNMITKPIKELINENEEIKHREFHKVNKITTNIREFDELSTSQYTMAHAIDAYQKEQAKLLDSIIKMIADAIDVKSIYTGAHCHRVPLIAKMILDASSYSFTSEDEQRAFEIGSWLHDCGKLTTPEYVVDKSTKLETIYNRIHEIRTRFEVLLRDAKITYYEAVFNGQDKHHAQQTYEQTKAQLMDDFAFIAQVNIGGEYLDESSKQRIRTIASKEWIRHFDNTLGLSQEEQQRTKTTLTPAVEKLLDDKPEHLIQRNNFDAQQYVQDGFKLEVPEYLYNRGEITNLCIERGTLTDEERYKINEHVIMTIKMLENIPFPQELSNIPKYAGTHHETLNATGYPRKLSAKDLSFPERVMALADIFEALTASDRPYKKAKKLSETIKILSYMVKDMHIDKEVFRIFLESKVYLKYAQEHLKPEQIDDVDISQYL